MRDFAKARLAPLPAAALALLVSAGSGAFAACPIELSTFADRDGVAEINFMPAANAATVTNSFRMLLDHDVVLDGIVQWSEEVSRPYGMLMYKCPEGDVTGQELAACTLWQGVIYTSDSSGKIDLLPAEGKEAPATLLFPDLAQALRASSAYGENGFSKLPWDVFALKGCQE